MKWEMRAFFWLMFAALICTGTEIDLVTSNGDKGHETTVEMDAVKVALIIIVIVAFIIILILVACCCHLYRKSKSTASDEERSQQSSRRNDTEGTNDFRAANETTPLNSYSAQGQSYQVSDVSTQTPWSYPNADVNDFLQVSDVSTQTPWSYPNADVNDFLQGIELRHKDHLQKLTKRLKFTLVTGNQFASDCPLDENYVDLTIADSPFRVEMIENEWKDRRQDYGSTFIKYIKEQPVLQLNMLLGTNDTETDRFGTTVVVGEAGIGKSTMVQKLIQDWSQGKIYQSFKFVFQFQFPRLNLIYWKTSLTDLVRENYPYLDDALEHLWKKPEKILFVFEDLNQFQKNIHFNDAERNAESQHQCLDPNSYCLITDVVRCLIQGELLKGCSILITSRTGKFDSFGITAINRKVQILGFAPDATLQYFHNYIRNSQTMSDIINYIKTNDTLYRMCYNPLYCLTLCSLLESPRAQGVQEMPLFHTTSTQAVSIYIVNLLGRSGYALESCSEDLLKLGALAYDGCCKNLVVFNRNQLSSHNMNFANVITALMMEIQGKDHETTVYAFNHFIIQHFLAALQRIRTTTENKLLESLNAEHTTTDGRFTLLSRFLVGLARHHSTTNPYCKMANVDSAVTKCVSGWLMNDSKRCDTNLKGKKSEETFLNLLYCFHEFGDVELTRVALSSRNKIQFTKCHLNVTDCVILSSTLMAIDKLEELDLRCCDLPDEGVQFLLPVLHKCKTVRLPSNAE
ncbi:NACHT, LRR and PYD domains-containing protein 1 homolog [Chiloscyllium punctatum]|uniref:NACHT, LRR and PYD domains-containing protein 1 homolog n=1 Tax=Chiloscyllium punctatum TaxID=137246 RepID=UPI003B63A391